MIVTVGNTKGGVGKTTVALSVAVEAARAGRRVWLVDADRQGTAMDAVTERGEREPVIAGASFTDGNTLRQQVKRQAPHYDLTIIDAGGRDSSGLRAALLLSDLVVIPFQPRSFDVWGLADMVELLEEARAYGDVEAVALLNAADPQGQDNAEAREAASAQGLRLLDARLGRRKAFANAAGAGLSAGELTGRLRDDTAAAEAVALYHAIMQAI